MARVGNRVRAGWSAVRAVSRRATPVLLSGLPEGYFLALPPWCALNLFGSTLPQRVDLGTTSGAERSAEAANWNLRFSTIVLESLRAY